MSVVSRKSRPDGPSLVNRIDLSCLGRAVQAVVLAVAACVAAADAAEPKDKRAIYSSGLGYGTYPAAGGAALTGLGAYGAYPGYGAYSGYGAYPYAGAGAAHAAPAAAAYPAYSGYQSSLAYPGYTAGLRGYSG
ncbi:hypothetical protein R5R35_000165 [Gryllus longicercus]|uniref:Uncharacterized protein n=1 Tax=Gryllus longicercus TaxID=2509291 RepID=A0AAN9WAR6_9ORTH